MKKYTVLVVDDIPKNIQVVGQVLNSEGYLVSAATNGMQALKIAEKLSPDIILLDITMPEMDGYAVCEKLKAMPETKDIPVIFLTARTETEDIVQAFEHGASDYITKPFKPVELLARVRTCIMLFEAIKERLLNEKLKGVLETAGAVCHEMNQPMQIISGYSELLQIEIPEENNVQEKISQIMEQIDRMTGITRKLMRITRYETKTYMTGKRIVDIERSSREG